MSVVFKPHETFRDDFSYRNSPQAIRRFPLPFPEDSLHVLGEHRAASARAPRVGRGVCLRRR